MEDVIARTHEKGVGMITIGTQTSTSKEAIEVAEKYDGLWCTVGLHPSHTHPHTLHTDQNEAIKTRAEEFDKEYYRELVESSDKVVAIGEVGLDYYRLEKSVKQHPGLDYALDYTDEAKEVIEQQKQELWKALELATEVDLPLVLHVRDAHADMLAMIQYAQAKGMINKGAVIHCFTGTTEEAHAYHDLGIYTSFTGIITFKDKKNPEAITPLMQTVKDLPLEWMMIETDAPYLAPHPHRGQQNEPWMVTFVAEKIAELKGLDVAEVDKITTENAKRFFSID